MHVRRFVPCPGTLPRSPVLSQRLTCAKPPTKGKDTLFIRTLPRTEIQAATVDLCQVADKRYDSLFVLYRGHQVSPRRLTLAELRTTRVVKTLCLCTSVLYLFYNVCLTGWLADI